MIDQMTLYVFFSYDLNINIFIINAEVWMFVWWLTDLGFISRAKEFISR